MSKKVTIGFEEDEGYRIVPVHGVWGGPTPSGDVMADFYIEKVMPPAEVVLEVDGKVVREVENKGERRVRKLMAGLMMRPELAYVIGRWLIAKALDAGYVPPEPATSPDDDRH